MKLRNIIATTLLAPSARLRQMTPPTQGRLRDSVQKAFADDLDGAAPASADVIACAAELIPNAAEYHMPADPTA